MIYLASKSPRRSQILLEAGIAFKILVPSVDEVFNPKESVHKNAKRLSLLKAHATLLMIREMQLEIALFRPESLAAWRKILNLGFTEAFRAQTSGPEHYSFWDYQAGAWDRNDGIRIDHFLMTPACADMMVQCYIDSEQRGREKPSDHVPTVQINTL